ncbi:MAG: hypothetical protein HY678_09025, partial [Chloroflexi bacterium]|nr:hypothetical protein [Chloroflexota bacterium]
MVKRTRKTGGDGINPEDLGRDARYISIVPPAIPDDFDPDNPEAIELAPPPEALSASELDQWEAARAAEQEAARVAEEAEVGHIEPEVSDDPVRMYLREIGAVNL